MDKVEPGEVEKKREKLNYDFMFIIFLDKVEPGEVIWFMYILNKVEPGEVEKKAGDFISYAGTPGEAGDF